MLLDNSVVFPRHFKTNCTRTLHSILISVQIDICTRQNCYANRPSRWLTWLALVLSWKERCDLNEIIDYKKCCDFESNLFGINASFRYGYKYNSLFWLVCLCVSIGLSNENILFLIRTVVKTLIERAQISYTWYSRLRRTK